MCCSSLLAVQCGRGGRRGRQGGDDWQSRLRVLYGMRDAALEQDVVDATTCISVQAARGLWQGAVLAFAALSRSAIQANVVTLNTLAKTYGRSSSSAWLGAATLLEVMAAKEVEADLTSYNSLLIVPDLAKQWRWPTALLAEMRRLSAEADVITANAFLKALIHEQPRWQIATNVVQAMQNKGLLPELITFSTSLTAMRSAGAGAEGGAAARGPAEVASWQQASDCLGHLARLTIQVDMIAVNAALSILADTQAWRQSLHLLQGAEDSRLEATSTSHCSSISGLGGNNWRSAARLLQSVAERFVKLSLFVANAALGAFASSQAWLIALRYGRRMRAVGLSLDTVSLNAMVSISGRRGAWPGIFECIERMRTQKLHPEQTTYSQALSVCTAVGQWRSAFELLVGMRKALLPPTVFTCSSTLTVCEKVGEVKLARQILLDMASQRLEPDSIAYNAYLSTFEKAEQWKDALDVFKCMREEHLEAGLITHSSMISAAEKGEQWRLALLVMEGLQSTRLQADGIAYNAAMSACEKGAQAEAAQSLLREMRAAGLRHDTVSYNAVASAFEKTSNWRWSCSTLMDSIDHSVTVDVITFNAALLAACQGGQWLSALVLHDRMAREGVLPDINTQTMLVTQCEQHGMYERQVEMLGDGSWLQAADAF
eukprot:TRINITY_DN29370_c1_g4_i1.p1 TRINITY_DN29370_c1_g4~~TRINITY_DN29370_c1_g4_i1.p1  ORF type:complete len:658 (+),score=171.19 TRINITY_DN29370_c1_g4_i1:280-2253(+)